MYLFDDKTSQAMANKNNWTIQLILLVSFSSDVLEKISCMTEDAVLTCELRDLCNLRIVAPLRQSVQREDSCNKGILVYYSHSLLLHVSSTVLGAVVLQARRYPSLSHPFAQLWFWSMYFLGFLVAREQI
jgi:hypothetical protein